MLNIFLIELFTVFHLSLAYLLYQLINRYVRDRSIFSNLEPKIIKTEKVFKEDIPMKQFSVPKTPDLFLKTTTPEIKVETSFENSRIGEYKSK